MSIIFFFFFNDTATTEIYTLSLHDALPISYIPRKALAQNSKSDPSQFVFRMPRTSSSQISTRSEEHTSELQSQSNLVCRLLLEKKKNKRPALHHSQGRCSVATSVRSI